MAFLIGGANSAADTAFSVANSCRFTKGDNAYLSKSLGAPTDADKFTVSYWIKLGDASAATRTFFNIDNGSSVHTFMQIKTDHVMIFGRYASGYQGNLTTNQVFRDHSAWYNVVQVYDSGNATAGNRMRMYINGTEVTSFSTDTNPDQDLDSSNIDGATFFVGAYGDDDELFDGYLAEFCFIDGLALTPSSFGEFDEDSPTIWKPKDVSGLTFGNNGFYLDFEASANLGNDANGGTDLGETNLAAADQATDTPTNSFCTLSPLNNWEGSYTLSEGNCIFTGTGGNDSTAGTMGAASGKWYFEVEFDTNPDKSYAGFAPDDLLSTLGTGHSINSFIGMYRDDYTIQIGGGSEGAYTDVSAGDIFGFAINLDAASGSQTVIIQKNGSTIDTVTIPTANEGAFWLPIVGDTSATDGILKCNFGGCPSVAPSSAVADANGYGSFEYNPTISSVDYLALCSKNLGSDGG